MTNVLQLPPVYQMTDEQIAESLEQVDEFREIIADRRAACAAICWVENGDLGVMLMAPGNDWARLIGTLQFSLAEIIDMARQD